MGCFGIIRTCRLLNYQQKPNSSNFRCTNSDNPFLILGITDSSNDMSCPSIININDGYEDKEEEKTC